MNLNITMDFDLIVIGLLVIAVYIVLRGLILRKNVPRQKFLENLTGYLNAKVSPIEGLQNSYRLEFTYRNQPFVYEDIEQSGIEPKEYTGHLRTKANTDLSVSFREGKRPGSERQVSSWGDLIAFQWGKEEDEVRIPPSLKEFSIVTNDPKRAAILFKDGKVVKAVSSFKSTDSYGRSVMSLDITEGLITANFHPPGTLSPSWAEFQSNVREIAEYLEKLYIIFHACQTVHLKKGKRFDD